MFKAERPYVVRASICRCEGFVTLWLASPDGHVDRCEEVGCEYRARKKLLLLGWLP